MRKNVLIVIIVLAVAIAWRLWREFGRNPLAAQPEYASPASPVFPPSATRAPDAPATADSTISDTPTPAPAMALHDYVVPPEPDMHDDLATEVAPFAPESSSNSAHSGLIDQPIAQSAAGSTDVASPAIDEPTDAVPMPDAATPTAAPEQPHAPDDLIRIEGIGPKISTIVAAAGITTFAELAATNTDRLVAILRDANIHTANPSTWPEQAQLAAQGDWAGLKELQDKIKNGRVER